jgi:flagellar basal body-associated protein FliL
LLAVLVIVGGTVYWAVSRDDAPPPSSPLTGVGVLPESGGQTFTGIGRIRVSTADLEPGMVILFVLFNYDPGDKVFSEELVLKIRDFREIIVDYIGSFSAEELQKLDEEDIKRELLHRFNAVLRLGQIETLYFSDFLIIG